MTRAILLAGMLLWSATASAELKSGDPVYVRARDTRLLKEPGSTTQLARLQPGDKVFWKRASPKDAHYHEVTTENGKSGVIWYQNLSTTPPKSEVVVDSGQSNGKKVNAQAFASYGAAARGLSPATRSVAQKKANTGEVAAKLEAAERIARSFDAKAGAQ